MLQISYNLNYTIIYRKIKHNLYIKQIIPLKRSKIYAKINLYYGIF